MSGHFDSDEDLGINRSIFENSLDAILLTKPDGTILAANPSAEKMFEMTEEEIKAAGRVGILVQDENLKSALEERAQKGRVRAELTFKRKNGTTFPGEITSTIFIDTDGNDRTNMTIRDLSDLELAEKKLVESEKRYHLVADFTYDWEEWIDNKKRLKYVSPSCERITGYNAQEFLAKPNILLSIVHTDDQKLYKNHLNVDFFNENAVSIVFRIISYDNKIHWIEHICQPVYDDNGQFMGRRASNRDITERKKAEKALIDSEENYRHLLQYAPTAIYELDYTDPRFKSVNEAMCQLTGYSRDELLSMNPFDLLDSESKERFQERIMKVLAGEKLDKNVEFKVITKDGCELWVILNVKLTYKDGKIDGALVVGYDITERKLMEGALRESEERFRNLYENAVVGFFETSVDGRVVAANDMCAEIFGFPDAETMVEEVHDVATQLYSEPQDRHMVLRSADMFKDSHSSVEIPVKRRDGISRWVQLDVRPISGVEGQTGYQGTVTDITERKEKEMLSDALNKVNAYIHSTLDYNEIMQSIIEEGTKAIGAESSVINIREGDNWVVKFAYNFPDSIIGQLKSNQESPTSVYVANEKEAVAFDDALNDSRVNIKGMKLHGVASLLVAPIILKDEVKGIIAFYHHQKSVVFSKAQIDFANKLSSSLSQAIENAQLFTNIKKSEEKYHSLYSSMSEGVAIHDIIYNSYQEAVDYIIKDINPAYEDILGLKRSEVIGKKASELYGSGNSPYIEIYASVAEDGGYTQFETYFEPMDKYFSISVTSPEKGKFATVFEDITERKRAEEQKQLLLEAVQEERDKLSALINSISDEVWFADKNKKFTLANPSALHEFGLVSGGIDVEKMAKSLEVYCPDGSPRPIDEAPSLRALKGEIVRNLEEIVKTPASEELQYRLVNASPVRDVNGNIIGSVSVVRDITELKQAEIELKETLDNLEELVEVRTKDLLLANEYNRNLIETSLDPLVTIGPDGKITDVNRATEEVTGYSSKELVGTDFADYFTNPKKAKTGYQKVFQEGEVRDYPLKIKHRHGSTTPVLYNASVYKNESGDVVGVFAAARDITERQKAEDAFRVYWESLEEQVEQRTEELAKSNADLKQFAYVASHDLREPLRMITSFLQLLERRYNDQLDEDANEFIGFAVDGAKRLDTMIMDLLEYSRVANKEIQFSDVDLEEVIDQIRSNLNVLIEENSATINYDLLPTIRSDENQMLILLQNLISNAIKYRSDETPQIDISAGKEADKYVFSVKDNGIGIEPQHLERIFTIFNRLHTHEEYEGSGIGLSIAQRIVHQHGGEIWAESNPGKGSTFYFTIPKTNT
jgi:two-component system, chemotaxis family, sensor kinase Cph1